MSTIPLEDRVTALEAEVARLKLCVETTQRTSEDWIDEIWGSFDNDPLYEEAMRLGKQYCASLRPKPKKKR
jgi:hypothetical protein